MRDRSIFELYQSLGTKQQGIYMLAKERERKIRYLDQVKYVLSMKRVKFWSQNKTLRNGERVTSSNYLMKDMRLFCS